MKISFKPEGQWAEVTALTRGLKSDLLFVRTEILKDWGYRAQQIAQGHISAQDLGWTPLQPDTLRRKKEANFPYIDEILRATNTYYSSIKFWLNAKGNTSDTVYAGIDDQAMHPSGEKLGDIAMIHEYGFWEKNIPARPLWSPTLDDMKQNYTSDIMRDGMEILAIRLKKKYKINPVHVQ